MVCNVLVTPARYSGTFNGEADPILGFRLEYPTFTAQPHLASADVLNQFYSAWSLEVLSQITTGLTQKALESYIALTAARKLVIPFEAAVTYSVTYNQNCILSLYTERYEFTGGAHGETRRASQTWSMANGRRMELSRFFPHIKDYRAAILRFIAARIAKNPSIYFPDAADLAEQHFNEENFFLTPQGLNIYFQQYEIAPYASGLPVFTIPYYTCISPRPPLQ